MRTSSCPARRWLLLAVLVPALAEATMESVMGQAAAMRLSMSGETSIAVRESARIVIALENTGTTDLWINARLLVNSPHAPASMREVSLTVRGPDGGPRDFTCKV